MIFGAAPLTSGLIIFAAWRVSRADWLMGAGVVNIAAGLLLVAIGLVCLIVYCWRARASGAKGWKARAALGGLLLLSNFPAAAGLTFAAAYIQSSYIVTVENRSAWPLEGLSFRSPQGEYTFGTIPPKLAQEKTFHFAGEGTVTYDATLNSMPRHGIVDGYITGIGGRAKLVVTETGDVLVHHEHI